VGGPARPKTNKFRNVKSFRAWPLFRTPHTASSEHSTQRLPASRLFQGYLWYNTNIRYIKNRIFVRPLRILIRIPAQNGPFSFRFRMNALTRVVRPQHECCINWWHLQGVTGSVLRHKHVLYTCIYIYIHIYIHMYIYITYICICYDILYYIIYA